MNSKPKPGDVYLFDLPNVPKEVTLFFVVLHPHPKGPELLFTVPADTSPLIGSCDMGIPEWSMSGPLTLYLGKGLWLPVELFEKANRIGGLENFYVEMACSIHSRLVRGEWSGTQQQLLMDENPDYVGWNDIISRCYHLMKQHRDVCQ